MEPTKPRAVVYARISSDRTGAGMGVERQVEDCRTLADHLGLTVPADGIYSDNDVSAFSGKPRPGYKALCDDLRAYPGTVVLAWHTDRLHRRSVELGAFIDLCEATGATVQTVMAGPLDLSNAAGRLSARIVGAVAEHEVDHARERMRRAKDQAAAQGKFRGGPRAFGYEANGIDVRLDEAEALATAAAELLEGLSLNEVTRRLKAKGHTTTGGHPLDASAVRRILQKPRNAGVLTRNGQVVGPGAWPAIIDETTWRGMCALLADPKRRTSPGPERRWLLTGIARCGICGGPLVARGHSTKDRHTRPSYVCKSHHVSRDTKALDEHVTGIVLDLLADPELADLLTPARPDVVLDEIEAAQIRADLDDLAQACARGDVTVSQMATASRGLRDRLEAVEARLGHGREAGLLSAQAGAPSPVQAFLASPLAVQRDVVRELVVVVVSPGRRGRPKGLEPGKGYADLSTVAVLRREAATVPEGSPALRS